MIYAWSFPWFWGSCHLDTDTAVISLPWMTVGCFPPSCSLPLNSPVHRSTSTAVLLDRCFLSSEVFKMLCRTEPKPNWGATRKPDVEDISNNHCLEGAEKRARVTDLSFSMIQQISLPFQSGLNMICV